MAIVAVARDLSDGAASARSPSRRRSRRARHGRAAPRRGRDDRPVEGRASSRTSCRHSRPTGARALRAVRQHRTRQQLPVADRGAQARRDRRHRGGVRLGHGDGEVPQHRLAVPAGCGRARSWSRPCARSSTMAASLGRHGGDRAARRTSPATSTSSRASGQGRRSRQSVPRRRQEEIELVPSLALEAERTPPRSTTASSAAAPVLRSRRRWSTPPSRSRASVTRTS